MCVCVCLCQPVYRKPAGFGQLVKLKHPKLIYATPTLKRSTMPPGSPHSVYLLSLQIYNIQNILIPHIPSPMQMPLSSGTYTIYISHTKPWKTLVPACSASKQPQPAQARPPVSGEGRSQLRGLCIYIYGGLQFTNICLGFNLSTYTPPYSSPYIQASQNKGVHILGQLLRLL